MDIREVKSIIEGLLFTWGEPLEIKEIAKVLDIKKDKLEDILKEMIDDFDYNRRGLRIIKIEDKYQLSTRPEHYEYIKKLSYSGVNRNLSNAAMETLSIIAYKQPITKVEIDHIRGVRSDRAISTLLERQMIEEVGRLDRPGKPIIYGTTDVFLRSFGLESLDELPELKNVEATPDELNEK